MLFIILEAELQTLLKPKKASRRKAPKCLKCGNLMKGHKSGSCSESTQNVILRGSDSDSPEFAISTPTNRTCDLC